jgi:peroxiredoxin
VAISVDELGDVTEIAQSLGIPFPILYDPAGEVVGAYRLTNPSDNDRAVPSTFVVDQEGVIQWRFSGGTSHRAPFKQIVEQLQQLQG